MQLQRGKEIPVFTLGLICGPLEKEESLFRNDANSGFVCCRSVAGNQWCPVDRKADQGILEI